MLILLADGRAASLSADREQGRYGVAPTTSALVRIPKDTHELLRDLAREEQTTLQDLLVRAVEAYDRAHMLNATALAYTALQADPSVLAELREEQAVLDSSLMDGLKDLDDEDELAAMYAEMNPPMSSLNSTVGSFG